jgi:hypothetical protein
MGRRPLGLDNEGTSQIMTRLVNSDRAEYEALAAANEVSLSELMRKSLELSKEHFRKEAERVIKTRENLPHGVTPAAEDAALSELIKRLAMGESIHLKLRDAFTPRSKAIYRLLQTVWADEHTETSKRTLDKIAGRVGELLDSDPRPADTPVKRTIKGRNPL